MFCTESAPCILVHVDAPAEVAQQSSVCGCWNSYSSECGYRYHQFADRFLRIGFANDRLTGLAFYDLSDAVLGRFKDIMLKGLTICNRKFLFLGYSSSQLREHACWLYCEEHCHVDGAPTAQQIRASAGELANIRIPAKYAARLAQCFSSTYETFQLSSEHICKIPVVAAPDRIIPGTDGETLILPGEEFSDGVGVISSAGMDLVVKNLPPRQQQRLIGCDIAAIQIRMGGCKGVLARWDSHRYDLRRWMCNLQRRITSSARTCLHPITQEFGSKGICSVYEKCSGC